MAPSPHMVIARKYRPQKFQEVVGQGAVVATLKNALRTKKIAPAYLFAGPRGTGKTSLARLFAKALNCETKGDSLEPCNECNSCREITQGQSLDVLEIDGASHRGIDDMRSIQESLQFRSAKGSYTIYLIDEVHMLTKEAFNALLKPIEEPPEKVLFLFATTEPHKVPATILSRCQRFDLLRITPALIFEKLSTICKELQRPFEPAALEKVALFAEGSLRDAQSLLEHLLCFSPDTLSLSCIEKALGLSSSEIFLQIDQAFAKGDESTPFLLVETLYREGKDLSYFLHELVEHYRALLLHHVGQVSSLPLSQQSPLLPSVSLYTKSQIVYILEYLLQEETTFSRSIDLKLSLEKILFHLIRSKRRLPLDVLVQKVLLLEKSLASAQEPSFIPPSPPEMPPLAQAPFVPVSPTPPPSPPKETPPLAQTPFVPVSPALPPSPPKETTNQTPQELGAKREAPPLPQHRKDTLLRFAAVELEGTLTLHQKGL